MKKILTLFLFAFTGISHASSASGGKLHTIHFMGNGAVIVYTTGTISGDKPSCTDSNQHKNIYAIDGTSSVGKVQLTGLLSAYASGKNVTIIGAENCGPWGDAETLLYFYTVDS